MTRNTCPACRHSMRLWAKDARRPENADVRNVCLSAAKSFRDGPCFHAPREGRAAAGASVKP